MATALDKILQEVQALSPEDQQQLRRILTETLPAPEAVTPSPEETFQQHLVAVGLLRAIKRPQASQGQPLRHPRVTIQGHHSRPPS
jgi:hypothetical protein